MALAEPSASSASSASTAAPEKPKRGFNGINQRAAFGRCGNAKYAPEDRPLTPQQKRLALEYLVDLSETSAAKRAGYKSVQGIAKTFRLPHIKKFIQTELDQSFNDDVMSRNEVLASLSYIGRATLLSHASVVDVGPDGALAADGKGMPQLKIDWRRAIKDKAFMAAVSEINVDVKDNGEQHIKLKFHDKNTALTTLAKYHQLFQDTQVNVERAVFVVEGLGP